MGRSLFLLSFFLCTFAQPINWYQTCESTTDRLTPQQPLEFVPDFPSQVEISLEPSQTYQTIFGFGGAFTEATAYNFFNLDAAQQEQVLEAYWGEDGIGYSVGRVHMNSCDFCLASYNFDNVTGDLDLLHFDHQVLHDQKQMIPLIRLAQKTLSSRSSNANLRLFLTPWSPPGWMKTNGQMTQSGNPGLFQTPPKDYRPTWANYYVQFIDAYAALGIDFWGLTVQNEPMAVVPWESCLYNVSEEADFLFNFLGPTIRKQFPNMSIMIYDHNKDLVFEWAQFILSNPQASSMVDGVAFHWYSGPQFEHVEEVHNSFPDYFLLPSEACNCPPLWMNWRYGENYGNDILGDLNAFAVGWTDWNMLLDFQGGPNHLQGYCDAPIRTDANNQLFYQPAYYYMGHFSKFLTPGSVRIGLDLSPSPLNATAFITPEDSVVLIVLNQENSTVPFKASYQGSYFGSVSQPHSIQTYLFPAKTTQT